MRGFLLLCLVAVTTNADQLGYNYQPLGHDIAIGGSGFTSASAYSTGNELSGGVIDGASSGLGGFASANNVGNFGGDAGVAYSTAPAAGVAEFKKEFYTYSAPDDEFNDIDGGENLLGTLRKSLRVVFIKTPENNALTKAALQLAKQASEDRTAIYVLSKQTDIGELASRLQAMKNSVANKPEVHFVKYRTPEDAARAQQEIQAQYDTLGGQTRSSNEGVAPVLDFSSSSSVLSGPVGSGALSSGGYGTAASGYLPPALRLKK